MKTVSLIKLLVAPVCLTLVSCVTTTESQGLQNHRGRHSQTKPLPRYQAPPPIETPKITPSTAPETAPVELDSVPLEKPTELTPAPPAPDVAPPPPPPPAPEYGKQVPGRVGFVYPPGAEAKAENMVDVRDFTPGQKVRDPRTGKIFLVP